MERQPSHRGLDDIVAANPAAAEVIVSSRNVSVRVRNCPDSLQNESRSETENYRYAPEPPAGFRNPCSCAKIKSPQMLLVLSLVVLVALGTFAAALQQAPTGFHDDQDD